MGDPLPNPHLTSCRDPFESNPRLVSTASPLKPGVQLCSGVQAIVRPENSLMASAVKPYFIGESHCEE